MTILSGVFQWQISASSILIIGTIAACFIAWRSDQRSALRDERDTLRNELKDEHTARLAAESQAADLAARPSVDSLAAAVQAAATAIHDQGVAFEQQSRDMASILERGQAEAQRRDDRMKAFGESLDANTKALTILVEREHSARSTDQ